MSQKHGAVRPVRLSSRRLVDTAVKGACLTSRDRLQERMIESFRHRGLRKRYEDGETRFLSADEVGKIKRILSYLEAAEKPQAIGYANPLVAQTPDRPLRNRERRAALILAHHIRQDRRIDRLQPGFQTFYHSGLPRE